MKRLKEVDQVKYLEIQFTALKAFFLENIAGIVQKQLERANDGDDDDDDEEVQEESQVMCQTSIIVIENFVAIITLLAFVSCFGTTSSSSCHSLVVSASPWEWASAKA